MEKTGAELMGTSPMAVEHDIETDEVRELGVDAAMERRLKRKADLILIPTLAITYLFKYLFLHVLARKAPPSNNAKNSSLDRSNISNAHTAGLVQDLNLTGNQFNQVLTYYFIPFCLCGPPAGMLSKQFSAKYAIPFMMFGFGIASLCTAFVKNFAQLVACRCVVGLFEAGFLTA